ncbi:hypothetical protein CL176_09605 [Suicoccus acidiformans]|uniref:Uncharacterized protein n=1 Tax=Suicoccus acidiformans TaxID=2036206 RepID=A0A347WMC3_9LACT|nr:hypothetical protein CL176_09605 [Suicoccus acidiformans]
MDPLNKNGVLFWIVSTILHKSDPSKEACSDAKRSQYKKLPKNGSLRLALACEAFIKLYGSKINTVDGNFSTVFKCKKRRCSLILKLTQ